MQTSKTKQKLVLLSILFIIIFTYPFLSIANKEFTTGRYPSLLKYIFLVWLIVIILIFFITKSQKLKKDE